MLLREMNLKQLEKEKRKLYEDPEYFLKLVKPPYYYDRMALINEYINDLK